MFNIGDTIINLDREVVYQHWEEIKGWEHEIRGYFVGKIIDISHEWATCDVIGFIEDLNHPMEIKDVDWEKLMQMRLDNCKLLPQTINDPRMYKRTLI